MNVAAVVLDMDGVIVDTESVYKTAWQSAAAELGHSLDDEFYLTLVGRETSECEAALIERFGAEFPIVQFRSRWSEMWNRELETSGISTKRGLTELLSFLDHYKLTVALATSSDRTFTKASLCAAGLEKRFDVVVTGDQVARGKPAPDIYIEASRRLGVAPADCVALEDSKAGVIAASMAEMTTLMIPDLNVPSSEARKAAFRIVGSLEEAVDVISALLADSRL